MKKIYCLSLLIISLHGYGQRKMKKDQMKLVLTEIFIHGDTLSFQMNLTNYSLLGYTPQYVRFFIRERHITTRTAHQEQEKIPLKKYAFAAIEAKDTLTINYDFYQFTIPKTKELVIAVKEKNGSRDLVLHIKGKRLLHMISEKKIEPLFLN
jgi:Domain of unknown function (DUF4138)